MKPAFAAFLLLAALGAALLPADGFAAGSAQSDRAASPADGLDLARGEQALEDGDWARAVKYLERAARAERENADVFNLLAYAYRRAGRLEAAFVNYRRALRLDPEHRGAHEYIGEAYLMTGAPAEAGRHLARLREICGGPCPEAEALESAIARFAEEGRYVPPGGAW